MTEEGRPKDLVFRESCPEILINTERGDRLEIWVRKSISQRITIIWYYPSSRAPHVLIHISTMFARVVPRCNRFPANARFVQSVSTTQAQQTSLTERQQRYEAKVAELYAPKFPKDDKVIRRDYRACTL